MATIKLVLLLACIVIKSGTNGAATKSETEYEAEVETAGAAEIERALGTLEGALADSHAPWAHTLEVAREELVPVAATLEAHMATFLLHSRKQLEQLRPLLEERLAAAQAQIAKSQQELVGAAAQRGAAALAEAAAAVARARDYLASLAPAPDAAPDAAGAPHAN